MTFVITRLPEKHTRGQIGIPDVRMFDVDYMVACSK
jgi:hypothetical protein